MSEPIYYRRQRGTAILPPMVAGAFLVAAAAVDSPPVLWAVAVFLLGIGYLFSSLSIAVDRQAVRWHFGPGFWRSSVPISEIESVRPVRNRWWYGWGIRSTPHGWLYNVGGLDAVEMRLRSGKTLRLGTDEPLQLAGAIEGVLPNR